MPTALPPKSRIIRTSPGLISSESTRATMSIASSVVTRKPPMNFASRPAFSIAAEIALPPPWTTIGLMPATSRKTMSRMTLATRFGSFHGGAAHFDEEGLAAEGLEIGQGFDEGVRFVDRSPAPRKAERWIPYEQLPHTLSSEPGVKLAPVRTERGTMRRNSMPLLAHGNPAPQTPITRDAAGSSWPRSGLIGCRIR
jgi:hypothetical protein